MNVNEKDIEDNLKSESTNPDNNELQENNDNAEFNISGYNYETIKLLSAQTDKNGIYIEELVLGLVNEYCAELDNYIAYVDKLLYDDTIPITDKEIDDIILTLPVLLYSVSTFQESMGIREDIAKISENNKYNTALVNQSSGTVPTKQALAKLQTLDESMVTLIYQRATKTIKSKVEYATELLQSAKKVATRRIAELELTKTAPNLNLPT